MSELEDPSPPDPGTLSPGFSSDQSLPDDLGDPTSPGFNVVEAQEQTRAGLVRLLVIIFGLSIGFSLLLAASVLIFSHSDTKEDFLSWFLQPKPV